MRNSSSLVSLLLFVLLSLPALSSAQSLERGARVRIVTGQSSQPRVGMVLSSTADSAAVQWEHTDYVSRLALADATRLDVSIGKRRHARQGLVWGLASGLIGGGILGAIAYEPCTGWCMLGPTTRGQSVAWGAGIFGALGGGFGALIGALTTTEQWQPATLQPTVGVIARPTGKRLNVGASYSF